MYPLACACRWAPCWCCAPKHKHPQPRPQPTPPSEGWHCLVCPLPSPRGLHAIWLASVVSEGHISLISWQAPPPPPTTQQREGRQQARTRRARCFLMCPRPRLICNDVAWVHGCYWHCDSTLRQAMYSPTKAHTLSPPANNMQACGGGAPRHQDWMACPAKRGQDLGSQP